LRCPPEQARCINGGSFSLDDAAKQIKELSRF